MTNTHRITSPQPLPRTKLRLAAAVLALLTSSVVHGADITVLGNPPKPSDVETIRRLEDESCRAVTHADYATMERLWSEKFVVNHPGNAVAPSRAAVFELFRRREVGGRLYSIYEKQIDCITFNGDLAIVMGLDTVAPPNAPATTPPALRRYTNIWRFEKGTWLLIARQATMLAPGAPSGPPPSTAKP